MHIGASTVGLLLLALALPSRAGGQAKSWGIGFDAGLTRFWGGSEPVPPNVAPGARPYRPTTFALRADRVFGRSRVGLTVSYAGSGLGVEDQDLAIQVIDAGATDYIIKRQRFEGSVRELVQNLQFIRTGVTTS